MIGRDIKPSSVRCVIRTHLAIALALAVAGCGGLAAKSPEKDRSNDVPPQVIYRIDDHRFITLEDYENCHIGTSYYIDTRQNIRIELGRGTTENYRGRLINADPTGRNIVIPSSRPPRYWCSDRLCNMPFYYSTDSGRTFQRGAYYMRNAPDPYEDSDEYIIAVNADRLYIAKKWGERDYLVEEYPLLPGVDLRTKLPPGVFGDRFSAAKRPNYLDGLRTPSGQEYIKCDDSIRPANAPKGKK